MLDMCRDESATPDDLATLFGVDRASLPPHYLEVVARSNWQYSPIEGEELDRLVREFLGRVRRKDFSIVVADDKSRSGGAAVPCPGARVSAGARSPLRHSTTNLMGLAGMNFQSYYAHPDLVRLASRRPDFTNYRVATVQLAGPDGGSPPYLCCYPREGSLLAGFQAAHGFEIADAYMSNLPRRYVNFWDLAITGHPGFPRVEFATQMAKKFERPEWAYTQKLYLYEPINSHKVDPDGCIRTETPIDFAANYNLAMLSLANVEYIVSGVPLTHPRLQLLDSPTRADLRKLQCSPPREIKQAYYERGLIGRPIYVYRNDDVLPRVFAPTAIEPMAREEDIFRALTTRSRDSLANTAIAMWADLPGHALDTLPTSPTRIGKVAAVRGDHLQIEVSTETGGVVIVSNAFSPYWRASSGNTTLSVFPVYHAFIGIWLPPGNHVVDLRYRPPYAKWFTRARR